MKIALLGYGKMGQAIEALALERDHEIVLRVNSKNAEEISQGNFHGADVAIEFSRPESAASNIKACLKNKIPVAIGTTGWNEEYEQIAQLREKEQGCFLVASNFSIGVNLFFKLNRDLASLMNNQKAYRASMLEIHHTEKLDSPSGTAISLAEDLMQEIPSYTQWENQLVEKSDTLGIASVREPGVTGTHEINYTSAIDKISIRHEAFNRDGFALGAILAAEFIYQKSGIFTMEDVLNNH